jgi:hypothetical protein
VLSWACRRFRARFSPGSAHPHRRACRDCDAFASALEQAAGVRLPLPAGLRRRLEEAAAPAAGAVLPFPVPRLPLPAATAARLRTLGPAARRPSPPEWARNPRYALAASALLALLLGPFLSAAAGRSLETLDIVRAELSPLAMQTQASGRQELEKLRRAAAGAEDSARRAAESIHGLSDRLSAFLQTSFTRRSS